MTGEPETLIASQPHPFTADWYRQRDGKDPFAPDLPTEYCSVHAGDVDEGRTQPLEPGSRYRICDGCQDERRRAIASRETYCPGCGYLNAFHIDSRCPSEAEARNASGSH